MPGNCVLQTPDERLYHLLLKACREVHDIRPGGFAWLNRLNAVLFDESHDRGLQTAETEIEIAAHSWNREDHSCGVRVACLSELIQYGTSRITQAQELGYLVVGFAGRIVASSAKNGVLLGRWNEKESRMAARYDQSDCGVFNRGVLEHHRKDVSFYVVDSDYGLVQREGQRFSIAETNQQRAYQPRALSDRYAIDTG